MLSRVPIVIYFPFRQTTPYHEWALLTIDRLVREPGGVIIAVRLQVKGGRGESFSFVARAFIDGTRPNFFLLSRRPSGFLRFREAATGVNVAFLRTTGGA